MQQEKVKHVLSMIRENVLLMSKKPNYLIFKAWFKKQVLGEDFNSPLILGVPKYFYIKEKVDGESEICAVCYAPSIAVSREMIQKDECKGVDLEVKGKDLYSLYCCTAKLCIECFSLCFLRAVCCPCCRSENACNDILHQVKFDIGENEEFDSGFDNLEEIVLNYLDIR